MDRLLDFYGPLDVGDARAFIAGLVAVFAHFPPSIYDQALDPFRGIPGKVGKLSALAPVRDVLEDLYEPVARQIERDRIASQPRTLPAPPRSPEQQAAVDAQVTAWRKQMGIAR